MRSSSDHIVLVVEDNEDLRLIICQLRAEGSDVPFILLSLSESETDFEAAKRLGVLDFIEKPCKAERLFSAVDAALGIMVSHD